ncbi:MAG: methylenetetrahydrofolate reductase, partial [Limisphaerales bacterium]
FEFREHLTARLGVRAPITPGIVPILSAGQITKFTNLCGSKIPPSLRKKLDELGDDEEGAAQFGVEYATRQCEELLRAGAPGLHFYTLNKSRSTLQVLRNLGISKP